MRPANIPFTVIGGFLGAGKTTVVNHILRSAGDQRIVILVNDVGDTPIDPDLIAARSTDAITMTNGCICCSLSDEFALGLPDLLEWNPPIDRVVVEASGIGDPGAIAQYGTLPGFALDGVIVLADAERIIDLLADPRIGHQAAAQLRRAHLIAVTKVDLVDPKRRAAARSAIAEVIGEAGIPIIEVRNGEIPLEVLFGLGAQPGGAEPPQTEPVGAGAGVGGHGVDVETVDLPLPVEHAVLEEWLSSLPADVLRVKGVVGLVDGSAVTVQKVGPRLRITRRGEPVSDPRLVLISIHGTEIPDGPA